MELNTIEKTLINALNAITFERNRQIWHLNCLMNGHTDDKLYDLKFEKRLFDNVEIATLLEISTKLIDFHEIFSLRNYIDYFMKLFNIHEECRNKVEYNFNQHVFQYIKLFGGEILLIKYILNLTDVLPVIDKHLEDENLEEIVAKHVHSKTDLDLEYCKEISSDIIDHF